MPTRQKLLMMLLVISATFLVSCGSDGSVVCNNECKDSESGKTQCTTDKKDFETCTLQDNGCYEWIKTECTGEEACIVAPSTDVAACGTMSVSDCIDDTDCSGDTPVCDDSGVCVADTTNPECTSNADCSGDKPICDDSGVCVADTTNPEACPVDGCNESGITECDSVDGDILKTCTLQAEGCLKWEETDCSDNSLTCSDTTGTPACGISIK